MKSSLLNPYIKNLFISFSGGRTSAYMTYLLLNDKEIRDKYENIIVLFANTGQEYEETLEFVRDCDKFLNFNTVWVEAEIQFNVKKAPKHKIVDFISANRTGKPYEDTCKKYGIPNRQSPFCTDRLKLAPMLSYLDSIGIHRGITETAIGIRFDEIDRISSQARLNRYWYPLIDLKITKNHVLEFWKLQNFNLQLPEHKGNCKWCWKKSDRKLFTLIKEDRSIFDFPNKLEELYGTCGGHKNKTKRVFFRNYRSTKMLLEEADSKEFIPFTDNYFISMDNFDENLDKAGACSESCEVFNDHSPKYLEY